MKKTILALLLGLCALSSYAYMYDWNELPMIPKGYINQDEESLYNAFLYEKNVTIFGEEYPLIIRNIKLSRYWFECDIVIDNYDDEYIVSQEVNSEGVEYPQNGDNTQSTESTISTSTNSHEFIVHSRVRLYGHGVPNDDIKITYHFTDIYQQNKYDLILHFPYFEEAIITGIDSIELGEPTAVEYYDLQGRKLDGPRSGIVIEKQGNKVTKKMYR